MKTNFRTITLILLVSVATAFNLSSAATIYFTNDGFEQPDLGSGPLAYQYFPSSPGWIFSGPNGVGIATNGSNFNLAGATNGNHNGVTSTVGQAAFLQDGDGTLSGESVAQTLTLPAGDWFLLFSLEGRPPVEGTDGANGVNVFLDGVQIGSTLFPAHLGSFNNVAVNLGFLAGGDYTFAFAGTIPAEFGDHTTFLDNVRLSTTVPDSGSTLLLLTGAFVGLVVFERIFRPKRNAGYP